MATQRLSQSDVIELVEDGSSLSHEHARQAANALSVAGVDVVRVEQKGPIDLDGIVKSLNDADIGIKDRGLIGFGLPWRRNHVERS